MNNHNLTSWKKGVSGNPNGRPKKLINQLSDHGYNRHEVNAVIKNVLSMTISELKSYELNEELSILEISVIEAVKKSIDKADFNLIDQLLQVVYGKTSPQVSCEWN